MNQEAETEYVRELLGRVVDEVQMPGSRGSETVFAKASRVRWRRRTAATGVAAAAVAAGLVLGPGVLDSTGHGASVASTPTAGEYTTKAGKFAKLLPPGTGKISEISLLRLFKQAPKAKQPKFFGPYDGDYAVGRPDGVGYISVHLTPRPAADAKTGGGGLRNPCQDSPKDGSIGCTTQKLSDGSLLGVWETPPTDPALHPIPAGGREFEAGLRLKDGRYLTVRASTGFQGKGQLGPLLKTPPLTRAQLTKLIQNPALLK
ncbi:hypothetical protein CW362_23995 [Streptomyces populi]|uniref:Uncharacterized protein n=1 Tax=Streptomyces populi TaxID=2058924 RepID=A0A2I0SKU5_9ACTN|nr:hypothetical protein [Streptomyces populi]PKT70531.1 hypothetical protein CW362_23995 [Streptomyces populi]